MKESIIINLDIRIEHHDKGYLARVTESPIGGESQSYFNISDLSLDITELSYIKLTGSQLFTYIFQDEVLTYLRRSQDYATSNNTKLRIRLMLSDVPEIMGLPWESIYDQAFNHFFALSTETPFVRYLDLPIGAQIQQIELPLSILVMISNPEDYPSVNVEKEWSNINQALSVLIEGGIVTIKKLDSATLTNLQNELRNDTYQIFHFIGHGALDNDVGMLLLEDETGLGRPINGEDLGFILRDHKSLQLVILNACEASASSQSEVFSGSAQSLIQQDIPAVIAMQRKISDNAAGRFSQEFYKALQDGFPIDIAIAEGRKGVYASGNETEWITPVLYMRSPDGKLFDIPAPKKSFKTHRELPELKTTKARSYPIKSPYPSSISDFSKEITEITKQLNRHRLILFIGADFDEKLTGIPNRQTLADQLAVQEDILQGDPLETIAQQVMSHGNRWIFTDFLQDSLETVGKSPRLIHDSIASLVNDHGIELIITTAYDDLLEQSFKLAGSGINVVVEEENLKFIRHDRPTLIKLYGDINQVTSLTVTEQDQNALLRGREKLELTDEIAREFRRNSVLFLGHDPTNRFVQAWFDEIAGDKFQIKSYIVWPNLSQREIDSLQSNRGLIVIDLDPVRLLQSISQ
jgi:hypothetical protein